MPVSAPPPFDLKAAIRVEVAYVATGLLTAILLLYLWKVQAWPGRFYPMFGALGTAMGAHSAWEGPRLRVLSTMKKIGIALVFGLVFGGVMGWWTSMMVQA
jgi:hypothetical protein